MQREDVSIEGIERAMHEGHRLRTFSSGDRSQVVRIEKNGNLVCQGWEPTIEQSLDVASRRYFVRAAPEADRERWHGPDSPLRNWHYHGGTFEAWRERGKIVVRLQKTYDQHELKRPGAPYFYKATKTGRAGTFWEAVDAAFRARVVVAPGQRQPRRRSIGKQVPLSLT